MTRPATDAQTAEMRNVLRKVMACPAAMREIMRKNDLKIYDLDDPMQKLALTFYTQLCEQANIAGQVLEGETT